LRELFGSIGELTAVASAKRATRGVFNDGAYESCDVARGLEGTSVGTSCTLADILI